MISICFKVNGNIECWMRLTTANILSLSLAGCESWRNLQCRVVQKNPQVFKWFPAENICIIKHSAQIPSLWLLGCWRILCWAQVLKVSEIIKDRIWVRDLILFQYWESFRPSTSLHWAFTTNLFTEVMSTASTKTHKLTGKVCA